jgi:hypothetical protein
MKGKLGGRMGQRPGCRRAVLGAAFSVGLTVAALAGSAVAAGPAAAATKPKPLTAPKTTPAQDAQYLTDVAKADPALVTYLQNEGNAGLRAVLTDGSAFCAFLRRGGGIDNAMVALAEGARSVQSKTHLPATVRTYNTVESVALLTLCPGELKLVPASDRTRLRKLGKALGPAQG